MRNQSLTPNKCGRIIYTMQAKNCTFADLLFFMNVFKCYIYDCHFEDVISDIVLILLMQLFCLFFLISHVICPL